MDIQAGTKWNGYEIVNKLGQGGNCEVYKIKEHLTDNILALKILIKNQNVLRFKREFRSMVRLDHPNIARVYTFGEFDERACFTMELIEGGDLKRFVRRYREDKPDIGSLLPSEDSEFRDIADLFIHICEPLKYIHSRKIVHRDLKPANIMLTEDGQIKLMDFGLIKETDIIQEGLTQTGMFVGTVAYMSPEQGLGRDLDHRSDLYSLGIILYEALTFHLPFKGTSVLEIFMKHIKETPIPPSNFNMNIPPSLERLVLLMLSKEPSRRPNSAGEIIEYLTQFKDTDDREMDFSATITETAFEIDETAMGIKPGLLVPELIGREDILEIFERSFDLVRLENKSIFFIEGEAGIGKSRLLKEVSAKARMKGFSVLHGSCLEVERFPYSAFLGPLETLAERVKAKDENEGKLILANRGNILANICPRFAEIEWIQKQPQPVPLEPMQDKLRTFDAIKTILVNSALKQETFLVLEDIHWADDLSVEFLHYLARSLTVEKEQLPLIITASCRSEDLKSNITLMNILSSLRKFPLFNSIVVEPLLTDQTKRLIGMLLGSDKIESDLVDQVFKESGGNPFYIEEILKGLLEEELLVKHGENWVFSPLETRESVIIPGVESLTSAGMSIPDRIQDLISRRLARLDQKTRNVLIRAAIIGVRFEFSILLKVVDYNEDELLDLIDEAIKEDILSEVRGSEGEIFIFKHNMVRNVLYSSLSSRRQSSIHFKIAEAIYGLYGPDNQDYWELLAYHFDKAKKYKRAIEYYAKSADQAVNQYVHQTAQSYSSRILELASLIELDTEKLLEYRRDAYRMLGFSYEASGNLDQALIEYSHLVELGASNNDASIEAIGHYFIGGVKKDKGEFDVAMDSFRKCLEMLPDTEDNLFRRATAMGNVAGVFINLGQYDKALNLYSKVKQFMKKMDRQAGMAMCDMNIGMVYYYLGKYEEAFEWLNSSIELYKDLDDPYRVAKGLVNLGGVFQARGETLKAATHNTEALEISRKIQDIYSVGAIQGNLGVSYHEKGEYEKSVISYRESLRISRELGDKSGVAVSLINMGNLMTDLGDIDGAFRSLDEATQISEEMGERWLKACADHQFGEIFLAQNQLQESQIKFNECYNEAEHIGLRPLQIQSRANLAWIDALNDQLDDALKSSENSLNEAVDIGDSDAILRAQSRFAGICLLAKKYEQARLIAAKGLKLSKQRGHVNLQWRFYTLIGQTLAEEKKFKPAHRSLQQGVNILLSINKKIEMRDRKGFFKQNEVQAAIVLLVKVCARLGYDDEVATYQKILEL